MTRARWRSLLALLVVALSLGIQIVRLGPQLLAFTVAKDDTDAPESLPTVDATAAGDEYSTCTLPTGNQTTLPVGVPHFLIVSHGDRAGGCPAALYSPHSHQDTALQIGTQKGGTSALYSLLKLHPNVHASTRFEGHFFDFHVHPSVKVDPRQRCHYLHRYLHEWFDLERYQRQRRTLPHEPLFLFEKTPSYLRRPDVAAKVATLLPNVRLVVVLRNPIDRMYSQFQMELQRGRSIADDFDILVEKQAQSLRDKNLSTAPVLSEFSNETRSSAFALDPQLSYGERRLLVEQTFTWYQHRKRKPMRWSSYYIGMYAMQLDEWLEVFDRQQMLILDHDRFQANQSAVFGDLLDFLGIPRIAMDPAVYGQNFSPTSTTAQERTAEPMRPRTRAYLIEFFRPYNNELADLLGEEWRGRWD